MNTTVPLLHTGDGVNLIYVALIPLGWRTSIKKEALLKLRTTTKQPLYNERLVLLHLRLGDLCTQVWFGIASQIADDMLVGNAFIDHFIHRIFPLEQMVVPWHSPPVATLTNPKTGYDININLNTHEITELKKMRW